MGDSGSGPRSISMNGTGDDDRRWLMGLASSAAKIASLDLQSACGAASDPVDPAWGTITSISSES